MHLFPQGLLCRTWMLIEQPNVQSYVKCIWRFVDGSLGDVFILFYLIYLFRGGVDVSNVRRVSLMLRLEKVCLIHFIEAEKDVYDQFSL